MSRRNSSSTRRTRQLTLQHFEGRRLMAADTSIATIDTQAVESPTAIVSARSDDGAVQDNRVSAFRIDPNGERVRVQGNRNPVDPEATDLVIAGNAPTALETTLGDVVV